MFIRNLLFAVAQVFSSLIFERATHRGPIFVGKSRHRAYNFRARSKISIEIENFDRDQMFLIVGPSGTHLSSLRNTPSTAGNSMTTALKGPLRNQFWKKRRPSERRLIRWTSHNIFWGKKKWLEVNFPSRGKVKNVPSSRKSSLSPNPSFPGKTVHYKGKGKLFPRENLAPKDV